MFYKDIPVNVPLTDSLSLKIPYNECQILDERLTSRTFVYYEDLDAIDSDPMPPKPLKIESNGITVRVGLCEIPKWNADKSDHEIIKYINLTVSTKLLRHRYFEGINKETINILYEEFLSFEIFTCSLETFLSGMVSDIDICINRYSNNDREFSDALDVLFSQTGTKSKHLHKVDEKLNIGLAFGRREFAKPSLPFIKLYHKEYELLTKSADFYINYLEKPYGYAIKHLTRIEATIKNYEHKKRLDRFNILPMFKTLGEFLELTPAQLYDFVIFSINSYIENKPRKKAPDLSPTDHIIYELLQNCLMKGYDHKTLLTIADTFTGSSKAATDVARSRMRKKITDLFDLLIFKDVKIQTVARHNAHVLEYLNFLNIKL